MDDKASFIPFRRELLTLTLAVITVILLLVEGSSAFVFYQLNAQYQDSEARNVRDNVHRTLLFQDRALLLYEQQLEKRMQHAMELLQQKYAASGGIAAQIDLQRLRAKLGPDIDLFLIDGDNRICFSTFAPDIGIEIARPNSSLAERMQKLRSSGEYWVDRPSVSQYDGVKKFSYQATSDGRYLLEVGISLAQHHDALGVIDFNAVVGQLVEEHDILDSVQLYDRVGASFNTQPGSNRSYLDGERLAALRAAVQTSSAQRVVSGNLIYEYVALPHQPNYLTGKVVEIVFDTGKWQSRWHAYLLMHGAIALLTVIGAIVASFWLTRRTARPLLQLSQSVRKIAGSDFSEPVQVSSHNEIGLLAQDIDGMRRKLASLVKRLETSNLQLSEGYDVTIRAFFKALAHRESGTASHSLRVNQIAMDIGRSLQLDEQQLLMLEWGTLLHDIGKLAIGDAILLKPGPLTDAEYELMKDHPEIGYSVLQDAVFLHDALDVSRFHHEKFDGTGYPHRLAGEEIPLLARICSVADAFEAMTADRPYRNGMALADAAAEIRRGSGTQFDPQVVAAFFTLEWTTYTPAPS